LSVATAVRREVNLSEAMSLFLSAVLPPAALFLPLALTLWVRRKARNVSDENRVGVWFSCVRFLRYLSIATLLCWWVATDIVDWKHVFDLFLIAHGFAKFPGVAIFSLVILWLPPVFVVMLCQVLFQPVYSGVRGVQWTRAELARQSFYSFAATFFPLLLVISGFNNLFQSGGIRSLLFSYFLAAAFAIFFGRRLRKELQLSPNALTTGELRDRAFFLAGQLGIKLQQIYLLPPNKSRMANAFARSGRSILFTHYLLTHLTRREVDSVVAHELAHIKHDHPRFLGFALMSGFAAVAVPYFAFPWRPHWKPLFDVLFVVIPLLTYYVVARRFEFTADATSVRLTGDPAAMITALVKLHRLNLLPLQWGKWNEKFLTHPSTIRRADAIARLAHLSDACVAQLLRDSAQSSASPQTTVPADTSQFYPLPTPSGIAQKVFSTEFKHTLTLRSYLLSLLFVAALPALLLRALAALEIFNSGFLAFVITLFITAGLFLVYLNFLPFFGYPKMARKMIVRAESEAVIPRQTLRGGEATLVGLSPGPAPRIFEGNYSWDAGFLFFSGERWLYVGEETRFSLRRDQVVTVQLGPGMPGWFRARSLYIVWRDSPSSSSVIFNVRALAVRSVLAMNRSVRQLAEQFESWRAGSNPTSSSSAVCEELPPPDVRAVTGTSLHEAGKPERLPGFFILIASIAGVIANFLHLPIEGVAPMFSYPADAEVSDASISGWYAIVTSCFLFFLLIAPALRARNSSVTLPANTNAAVPPPSPQA
jgi:Zn-dependent protease with chaperone function